MTTDGKLPHFYLDGTGEQRIFSAALVSATPGQQFEVDVTHNGDALSVTSKGKKAPRYVGIHPDQDLVNQLRAEHHADSVLHAAQNAQKKDWGDELEEACQIIADHRRHLRSYHQRAAFDQWVTARISGFDIGKPKRRKP